MPVPYTIGDQVLHPLEAEYDGDPRGLIWMWEPPIAKESYVMAVDPTVGRTGWSRATRTDDDYRIDNGAIEILRVGRDESPDAQVCEFAAPIDAEELGVVANALGRLFCGKDEQQQALSIIEMYPGPGLLTFREMIQRGYTNHFVWKYLDSMSAIGAQKFGFWPSREANKYLWIRASRHIHSGKFLPRSEWLVEEMRNCAVDVSKMWGAAVYGKHDDRVRAMMMALWAIHDWSMQIDTSPVKVSVGEVKEPDWQASDVSLKGLMDKWEERFAELSEA